MAWIKSYQSLANHPKLLQIAAMLGLNQNETIGVMHRLWWWALDYAEDGNISKYPEISLAAACGLKSPDGFLQALFECGFVDDTEEGLAIHDWWTYAGPLLQSRYGRDQAKLHEIRERCRARKPVKRPKTEKSQDPEPAPEPEPQEKTEDPKEQEEPATTRFKKPTYSEVNDYCLERENGIDAQAFIDFYEQKGWVIGKSPMKDWQAAVRTWEARRKQSKDGQQQPARSGRVAALREQAQKDTEIQAY